VKLLARQGDDEGEIRGRQGLRVLHQLDTPWGTHCTGDNIVANKKEIKVSLLSQRKSCFQ